jgi:hypothetical protein
MDIEWYPIQTPKELLPKGSPVLPDWVHPILVNELGPGQNAFKKINDFADTQEIIPNDYYAFMCDDNMYEPGFFDIIRKQTAKVIICSLYRGDTVPPIGVSHPATTIRLKGPKGIRPGNIDIMQYIIKGEIFKQHRFDVYDHGYSDGHYAVALKKAHLNDMVFLPDLFGLFNYFQTGRYTKKEALLKPRWSLPEVTGP